MQVSIYESGSGDDTPKFVAILELLLTAVGKWGKQMDLHTLATWQVRTCRVILCRCIAA
jgi:hypothetical protein